MDAADGAKPKKTLTQKFKHFAMHGLKHVFFHALWMTPMALAGAAMAAMPVGATMTAGNLALGFEHMLQMTWEGIKMLGPALWDVCTNAMNGVWAANVAEIGVHQGMEAVGHLVDTITQGDIQSYINTAEQLGVPAAEHIANMIKHGPG